MKSKWRPGNRESPGWVTRRDRGNLSKPLWWSWGCVAVVDSQGQTIWIADTHRDNEKPFVAVPMKS